MSKRSERREADRQARKLAYQAQRQQPEAAAVSEAQLAANRANAQLSTGPVTAEGRAQSSKNALKHGLTSKTVVLPYEDSTRYQQNLDSYMAAWQPATDEELQLVQSLVDCDWRLSRIGRLETAILLKGHLEFASKYEDRDSVERAHLIEAEAYLKYEKQLRNLHIQEARLRRLMDKARAELVRLRTARKRQEQATAPAPASQPQTANGFEFSTSPEHPPVDPKTVYDESRTEAAS